MQTVADKPYQKRTLARHSVLVAAAASLFVAALGLICKYWMVDRALGEQALPMVTARDFTIFITLLFFAACLVTFAGTLVAIHFLQHPLHLLAESIALSSMAEVPAPLVTSGSKELQLVAKRYNSLVEQVAQTNRALRRDAEQERQRAEAVEDFSDLVLAGVPSGILAVDEQQKVVRANHAALTILQQDREALLGQCIDHVLGPDHPVALAAQQVVQRQEHTYSRGSQSVILSVSSGAIENAAEQTVGYVVIFADLTELRQLEQDLELKARLSSLGEVAAGLAHEIRNPLGALKGFMELLQRRIEDPQRASAMLTKMLREVDVLATVVGDFLAFARPAPPMAAPLNIGDLLQEALDAGIAAADAGKMQTTLACADCQSPLVADAAQIRRALVNFVINACQAVDGHGELEIGAKQVGPCIHLYVQDNGPGVPKELQQSLATPFKTTKRTGTGLGLAVAHQIAKAHGGELFYEHPQQGGARFVLALPAHQDSPAG